MVYRQGIKNHKISINPARGIERRKENNERVRYLLDTEEVALRNAISLSYPERLVELDIALHTGMRRSEQFNCDWKWVNLERCVLTIHAARVVSSGMCT